MNPLLALDQLDVRMQQRGGGRRDTERFATPYDQAVQMIRYFATASGSQRKPLPEPSAIIA
jgi:hypothetical protein